MGALRTIISKDWLSDSNSGKLNDKSRKIHKFEQMRVTRSEDLPELITLKEAAKFLRRDYTTIKEYRNDGSLRCIKIRGRYFTTPEFIAEFIESESRKR